MDELRRLDNKREEKTSGSSSKSYVSYSYSSNNLTLSQDHSKTLCLSQHSFYLSLLKIYAPPEASINSK